MHLCFVRTRGHKDLGQTHQSHRLGSGSGAVDRTVASDSRDPRFESSD